MTIKIIALDIYPNQDELTSMMYEADTTNKGFINESDFMYIIAKQKIDYRTKLVNDASKSINFIKIHYARGCIYCIRGNSGFTR